MATKKELTIEDIARALSVSKTTVSRAITGNGRISPATKERVRAYIQEHHYRPVSASNELMPEQTHNIALVLPQEEFSTHRTDIQMSINAVFQEAFSQDYNVLICPSDSLHTTRLHKALDKKMIDSAILFHISEHDPCLEILAEKKIPFASVGSLPSRYQGGSMVTADHKQYTGCYALTRSLLENSPVKTALLGNDIHHISNQNCLSGFRTACQELDIPMEDTPIRMGLSAPDACVLAVDALLQAGVHRFICMDDQTCTEALHAIKKHGLCIPDDVELVSMYDSASLASNDPPITALQFDTPELCRHACLELLNVLHQRPHTSEPSMDCQIIWRSSTM